MKALVTGGAGFLGLYITEQLVARGDDVRVFCRRKNPRLDELEVDWVAGDIRDTESVTSACDGIDAVFHVAAVPGVWGSWKLFHDANTMGTLNVIDACRKQAVAKLVYTSTASVVFHDSDQHNVDESAPYPPAKEFLCHYARTKALAERAILEANQAGGPATVSLRPHLIWGPRDNHLIPKLIHRARSGRLWRVGEGAGLVSMIYVENAAAAHLQAADALTPDSPVAGQAYFISEREPVNLWAWIDDLLKRAGLPSVQKKLSAKAARRLGAALETLYWLLRLPSEPPMTRFLASQLSNSHYYDASRARRDFNYSPLIAVEEGMRRIEPELRELATTSSG